MLKGPDVSYWQGFTTDWKAVKNAGASFAFCKCCEGQSWLDPTFATHWNGIASAGLVRGTYAFGRPDTGSNAQDEAKFFLSNLPDLNPGDLVALDLEVPTSGAGDYSAWALAWLSYVEERTGFRPLLYTGPWYAQGLGRLTDAALARYGLWNASYASGPAPPAYKPWSSLSLWQWTSNASYPTLPVVDESIWLGGTLDDLRKLGKPAPKTPPPASPPPTQPHWKVTTPTHLRPRPQVDAMPLGPLLPSGTFVAEVAPPRGLPAVTGHWKYVRTGGDVRGYAYAPDLVPDKP